MSKYREEKKRNVLELTKEQRNELAICRMYSRGLGCGCGDDDLSKLGAQRKEAASFIKDLLSGWNEALYLRAENE